MPMSVLRATPFSLTKDTVVVVKIRAKNVNGWGEYSVPNTSGALIQTEPGTMTDPYRGDETTEAKLHVVWDVLTDNGGTAITSYHLQYKKSTSNDWIDKQGYSPLSTLTYAYITKSLVSGAYYDFRVRARNVHGWGAYSSTVSFRVAKVPYDISSAVVTSYVGTLVRATWTKPSTGGISLTSYTVQFEDLAGNFISTSE